MRTYSFTAAGRPGRHTERRARAIVLSLPNCPPSDVAWSSCSTCARSAPAAGTQRRIGAARDVHDAVLVFGQLVEPMHQMMTDVALLLQPLQAGIACVRLEGLSRR